MDFVFKIGISAESTTRPSRPHRKRAAQPAGTTAQRTHGRAPHSGSKSDPIAPDPTQ
jgi:hypothetical protein